MASTQDIAARLVPDLMRELGLSREQALGLAGNLAHESMGFRDLTENGVKGRGGYGYAQWTGDRRTKFEKYAKSQGLKPSSYEANLGFIVKELKGSEKAALKKIKSATTADQAASVAMTSYFRPGKPQLNSRQNWTDQFASSLPNSALSAINAVAPTPMPARPAQLSAFAPIQSDNMRTLQDALNAKAERMRNGTDGRPVAMPRNVPPQISAARVPVPPDARGVGTPYLAPATKVPTYKVDSLGNPIVPTVAQATPSPSSTVGYGPDWNNLQGMVAGAWDPNAKWNNVGPRPEPFVGGVVPSQSKQTPQQIANERIIAGIPLIGPLAVGLGTLPALLGNTRTATATPQPQPTTLPAVIPEPAPSKLTPPQLTAAQRSALASTGSTSPSVAPIPRNKPIFPVQVASNGTYSAPPAPIPAPLPTDPRLPKGDPALENFKRGQDIASALYPRPSTSPAVAAINGAILPRLPMMPSPAMSAARLPTVPVRTAPIAPARTPLPQTRTVNPMSQIVPAVQARAGQGLLGGLLNMLMAGNVPQANTALPGAPTNRPAWQNNPNVQRDDKWAAVLDNFGMIR